MRIHKAATADNKKDLFTKELDRAKFEHALNMIQMNWGVSRADELEGHCLHALLIIDFIPIR